MLNKRVESFVNCKLHEKTVVYEHHYALNYIGQLYFTALDLTKIANKTGVKGLSRGIGHLSSYPVWKRN